MKPSHYHYIKRMWTRYLLGRKQGCCFGSILKVFAIVVILCLILSLSPILSTIVFIVIIALTIDRISYSRNPLQYYKNRFNALNDEQIEQYKALLSKEVEKTKELAHVLNTTTDIIDFTNSFEDIICTLEVLIEHEFTGFFSFNKPTSDLNRILENKHLSEIDFIKRAYSKEDSGYIVPSEDTEYFQTFTAQARNFAQARKHTTGIQKPIKKHLSNYELELFAKQCNTELEYEDKKERWNSESNKV